MEITASIIFYGAVIPIYWLISLFVTFYYLSKAEPKFWKNLAYAALIGWVFFPQYFLLKIQRMMLDANTDKPKANEKT